MGTKNVLGIPYPLLPSAPAFPANPRQTPGKLPANSRNIGLHCVFQRFGPRKVGTNVGTKIAAGIPGKLPANSRQTFGRDESGTKFVGSGPLGVNGQRGLISIELLTENQ